MFKERLKISLKVTIPILLLLAVLSTVIFVINTFKIVAIVTSGIILLFVVGGSLYLLVEFVIWLIIEPIRENKRK